MFALSCFALDNISSWLWLHFTDLYYLIALAAPHMKKSTVVDSSTGGSKDSRFLHYWNSKLRLSLKKKKKGTKLRDVNLQSSFCLTVLYAGCIQVQESFLEEDRIKLFIQSRKDSRLHLHTYRYVIFLVGLKSRSFVYYSVSTFNHLI